jgi:hypothetical protein
MKKDLDTLKWQSHGVSQRNHSNLSISNRRSMAISYYQYPREEKWGGGYIGVINKKYHRTIWM